jgi:short-subunit dehydrogenase
LRNSYYTLITGASEGLGKSFALECASREHNLVLVALPGPELHHLSTYLQKNFNSEVVVIEQDLSLDNSALIVYNRISSLGIEINMLINNAGIGNTRFFEEESTRFFEKQIRLNVMATTMLTHLFIPMLKSNSPSHILNVGSLACFFSIPRKQVYGGTKSFIYFFSRSLRQELAAHNINVTVLCPGGINTNAAQTMLNKSGSWISVKSLMNPEEVAPLALDGLLKKKDVIIPGKLNRLFVLMDRIVPVILKKSIIRNQIGRLSAYRAPAMVKRIDANTVEPASRKVGSA